MVEANQAPWQRSYDAGQLLEPMSFSTEKAYQGQNALRLALTGLQRGYEDNRWITEKAANALGATVRRDQGVPVLFFTDQSKKEVVNPETGMKEERIVKLDRPILVVSRAYNIHEVDGIEAKVPEAPETLGWESAKVLDHLLDVTQARIIHGDSPSYTPSADTIMMPPPASYKDEGGYNKTLMHELSHWTGADKRINRNLSGTFGTTEYAREELVAEISAMLTCQKTGLAFDPNNGEGYIKNWWGIAKEMLQNNPNEIMKIAKDAYAARDYIVEGKELDRLKEESVEHKVELSDEERAAGRISLNIPYSAKNEAKAVARAIGVTLEWDKANKGWYAKVEDGQNIGNLAKFRTTDAAPEVGKQEIPKENQIQAVLDIPYPIKDLAKDEAKSLDVTLSFDRKNKNWKATGDREAVEKLQKFVQAQQKNPARNPVGAIRSEPASDKAVEAAEETKVFLDVPFKDKEKAKETGKEAGVPLHFDRDAKAWYCHHDGALPAALKKYEVRRDLNAGREEVQTLADKLIEMGAREAIIPEFDGKFHRIAVHGDKPGEKSMSYKAYNNGVPNAVIVNHQTGEKAKWLGNAPKLSGEERKQIELSNANVAEKSRLAAALAQKKAARAAQGILTRAMPADPKHPYLESKGIQAHHLKQDEHSNLLVPIVNTAGKIRGYQKIGADGQKRFAPGAEKAGNFATFGKLQDGKPIVIAEGIATAATICETSGVQSVAALDCHNLKAVALELRKAYPDSPIVIAADNDQSKDRNIGLDKATAAAEAVGGRVIYPRFDKETEKDLSDFNDLARVRGKEAVSRDVSAAVRQREEPKPTRPNNAKEGRSNER